MHVQQKPEEIFMPVFDAFKVKSTKQMKVYQHKLEDTKYKAKQGDVDINIERLFMKHVLHFMSRGMKGPSRRRALRGTSSLHPHPTKCRLTLGDAAVSPIITR